MLSLQQEPQVNAHHGGDRGKLNLVLVGVVALSETSIDMNARGLGVKIVQ